MSVEMSMRLTPKQAGKLYQKSLKQEERIKQLEQAIRETIGFIEETNSLKPEDGGDSLKELRWVLTQ